MQFAAGYFLAGKVFLQAAGYVFRCGKLLLRVAGLVFRYCNCFLQVAGHKCNYFKHIMRVAVGVCISPLGFRLVANRHSVNLLYRDRILLKYFLLFRVITGCGLGLFSDFFHFKAPRNDIARVVIFMFSFSTFLIYFLRVKKTFLIPGVILEDTTTLSHRIF